MKKKSFVYQWRKKVDCWAGRAYASRRPGQDSRPRQELLTRASLGFVFVTLVAVSAGVADEPKSKKAVKRDPKALEVLKQMATLYQIAKTLHVEATIETTFQNGEDKQEMRAQCVYDLERPDHVALHARHINDKDAGVDFVSDGKTQFLHSP